MVTAGCKAASEHMPLLEHVCKMLLQCRQQVLIVPTPLLCRMLLQGRQRALTMHLR